MRLLLNIWEQGYNDRVCREHTKHGWHLPHFSVLQPDKSTTKERIVFDESSKFNGKSFNDAIHSSPKFL